MIVTPDEIVHRARALAGAVFRPQGRDGATGLDCVGLVVCAFEIPTCEVPRDYRLRGRHRSKIESELSRYFRRVKPHELRAGDVMLCAIADDQMHLAISCGKSFVHADARLRRIVETPGNPVWPIIGVFRPRRTRSGTL